MKMYSLRYNSTTINLWWLDSNYKLDLVILSRYRSKFDTDRSVIASYNNSYYISPKYFLNISSNRRDSSGNRNQFTISGYNQYQFNTAMNQMAMYLTSNISNVLYEDDNGHIKVNSNIESIKILGKDDSILEFTLGIKYDQRVNKDVIGVFIYVNNADEPIFMSASAFMNMKTFLDHTDIFSIVINTIFNIDRFESIPHEEMEDKPSNTKSNNSTSFFLKEREDNNIKARKEKRHTKPIELKDDED